MKGVLKKDSTKIAGGTCVFGTFVGQTELDLAKVRF
jgi:hypothetical protein